MKAIIFDKDGTLLDFDPFWLNLSQAAVSALAVHLGAEDYADALKRAIGVYGDHTMDNTIIRKGTWTEMAEAFNTVLGTAGLPARTNGQEVEAFFIAAVGAGRVQPTCDGLAEVLTRLRERGLLLFVVTTDGPVVTAHCLKELGILDFFTEVISDDGHIPPKPDGAAIFYLTEKYRLSPEEICMVGDTDTDARFAQNGGISFIHVGTGAIITDGKMTQIPDVSYLESVV